MLLLLLFLWLASPLVLIPLAIINGVKASKLRRFANELRSTGRISGNEYNNLKVKIEAAEYIPAKEIKRTEPEKTDVKVSAEKDFVSVAPAACSAVKEENVKPRENTQVKPENASVVSFETKTMGSASVLFGIGVAFVILAGFIFSTAIWVYLSDIARTGIIGLAALLFFGISALAKKKFRLENTSAAFYMLGSVFTATTFVTAGIFELFGERFSVGGEGACMFFASALLIAAGFTAFGAKQYSKKSYTYISVYSIAAAVTLVIGQISREVSGDYEAFALLISIFGAAATALHYLFKDKISAALSSPVSTALISTRVVYACISLPLFIMGIFEWSVSAFTLCAVYLAELTIYGLLKKSKAMLAVQSLFTLAASFELCALFTENMTDDAAAQFVFTLSVMAFALIYGCIKQIKTPLANIVFMGTAFISSISLLDYAIAPYGIICMVVFEVLVLISALDFGNILSGFYRVFLPIPLIVLTVMTADHINFKYDVWCGSYACIICAAVFTAVSFACVSALKGDRRFASVKYSFELFTGFLLIGAVMEAETQLSAVLALILSIAAFAEIQTSAKNFHSTASLIAFFTAVSELISLSYDSFRAAGDTSVFVSMMLCAVFAFASRMFYGRRFVVRTDVKTQWDVFSAGILFSTFLAGSTGMMFSYRARVFIILTELAVFAANLCRREHSKTFNSAAITASAALFSLALINRPFMVIDNDVLSWKVTILIVAAFGYVVSKIWKSEKRTAERFSSGVYMLSYAMLLLDALLNETLFNTLIVLCTSLAILLYSFMTKKKRWFITSAIGLAGLTLYITKDFLTEIDWWVYLLLVGILLISIAAANEYFKGKGENVKQKAGRFFEDWQW